MPAHRKIPGRRSLLASVAGLAVILGGGTALVLTSARAQAATTSGGTAPGITVSCT